MDKELEFCRYEKDGHVARITITRPERMNALHAPANLELNGVWDDFAADDNMWVAVLTGEGDRAFSAGNDLKYTAMLGQMKAEDRPKTAPAAGGFGGITNRYDLFKPVIGRVNGFALGGGFEMALSCDIIIIADDAHVGLPEPRVGLIAGAMGVHRLPRQAPLKAAMGYMLTGRHIPAQRAYELGLVSEVVPRANLDEAVDAWIADILLCAPLSVRSTKEAALTGLEMTLQDAGKGQYKWEAARRKSPDSVEGPLAFSEKRPPNWTGA